VNFWKHYEKDGVKMIRHLRLFNNWRKAYGVRCFTLFNTWISSHLADHFTTYGIVIFNFGIEIVYFEDKGSLVVDQPLATGH
jgi:hypothetical protein